MFFAAWLLSFVMPMIRPARAAWRPQFLAGAGLFAALPILNALTTQTHLGITLTQGNWVYAGFDLIVLGIAALLAVTAWYASRTPTSRKPAKRKALQALDMPVEAERA